MKYTFSLFVAAFMLTASSVFAQQARLQVIHNAADPGAAVVDIYVNGMLFQDDFAFRTATPFVHVPAGVQLSVGVGPGTSMSASDIIASFDITLDDGKTYVAVANGVLDPMAFAANPEMRSTAFTLFTTDVGQESAMNAGQVDIKVLHGATDAPAVDVIARGVGTLVDNATYGDMTAYFPVPAGSYTLDITPAMDNSTIVASFTADLSNLGGGAAVVFASGFLAPTANNDGEAFGLYAALSDGTVLNLSTVTSVENETPPLPLQAMQVYPNPAREQTTLRFSVLSDAGVTMRIFDMSGREVYSMNRGQLSPGEYNATVNTSQLSPGLYRMLLSTSTGVSSTMVSVVR